MVNLVIAVGLNLGVYVVAHLVALPCFDGLPVTLRRMSIGVTPDDVASRKFWQPIRRFAPLPRFAEADFFVW